MVTALFLCMTLLNRGASADMHRSDTGGPFPVPLQYTVSYCSAPPVIDGNLDDFEWKNAAWTSFFTDIEGAKRIKPSLNTRVKMLWSDSCLFIAAELEEPHVWATLKNRDDIIFRDNDFEVFIDPQNTTHNYFEFEVNALNTIFDLFMAKPYRDGGAALISWSATGLHSAVKVNGTLNDPSDKDHGWAVEIAIPFKDVSVGNTVRVPGEGAMWRINFSRVEWDTEVVGGKYVKLKNNDGKARPERNWVWSPQGLINMHYPERWGYLRFTKSNSLVQTGFILPEAEKLREYLWLVYYRQKEYFGKERRYAGSLNELGLKNGIDIDGRHYRITMESTSSQFSAVVPEVSGEILRINDEGLIQQTDK